MTFGDIESLKEPLKSRVKAALGAGVVGRVVISPVTGLPIRRVRVVDPMVAAALPSPSAGLPRARRGIPGPKKQTATERAYNVECLSGRGVFEGIGVTLPGGSRYTADWYVPAARTVSGVPELHEVKGRHRFASQSRAVMAFREAAAARPEFRFVWVERQKGGGWLTMFDSKTQQREGKP